MSELEQIKRAIEVYFSNTSRSQEETLQGLEDIAELAESYTSLLHDDMVND